MKCFNLRKWRKNRKNTGALLELSLFNETTNEWENALVNVPFASAYAGMDEEEKPAALAMVKDGALWVRVTVYDDHFDAKEERKTTKKTTKAKPPKVDEDDDEEDDEPEEDTPQARLKKKRG